MKTRIEELAVALTKLCGLETLKRILDATLDADIDGFNSAGLTEDGLTQRECDLVEQLFDAIMEASPLAAEYHPSKPI